MSIRTRLVFSISPDCNKKFTEFIRVPSHNFTRQITFYVYSEKGGFYTYIDDTSAKILRDRKLRIKYEVFQKCDYQVTHLQSKGFISFSKRSSVYMSNNELLLCITIVDERSEEMSEITAVADESNFGLRSVAFQRINQNKSLNFKHSFNCLTEKLKMSCITSLDVHGRPRVNYKLLSKRKNISQTGIAAFQYARLVNSSVTDKKFNYRFNIMQVEPESNEHLVIISLGTTYDMESKYTIVERLGKVKKTVITEKISEKIRNIISKAVNILN